MFSWLNRNEVEPRASQCWVIIKRCPWSGWSLRSHIQPLPRVSNASVRTDLICHQVGFTPSPLFTTVFFHYRCLKTDTLTYGACRAGESLQAWGSPVSPLDGNSSAGLSGVVAFLLSWMHGLNGQASWPILMPVSGDAATGAHLTGRATPAVKKEIIFLSVGHQEKVLPKSWALDCFWSRMRDEAMMRTVLTYSVYSLWVIKISRRL